MATLMMIDTRSPERLNAQFPTTHWSRVVAAGNRDAPEAPDALAELCAIYWYPLYAFIRRRGNGPELAEDLVQGFFVTLFEKDSLSTVDRAKGRFRSFLMAACIHYLANFHDHDRALKRGRGRLVGPLNTLGAEDRYRLEPLDTLTAERLFERRWATTLLDLVLERLAVEMSRAGKARLFAALRPVLLGTPEKSPSGARRAVPPSEYRAAQITRYSMVTKRPRPRLSAVVSGW